MRAWREDQPFAFNGRYTQLRYVNTWPKPLQRPHPPIHIPGGGSVETYDFCIKNTYSYSYLSFFGYLQAGAVMKAYWDRVADLGADDSPYRAGFAQVVCVGETDAEAEKLYAQHVNYFYNRCLHIHPAFLDAPGYRTIKTIKMGALSQYSPDPKWATLSWKDLVDDAFVIAGSPATVRQRLDELIKTLRVGNLFLLLHIGDMPADKTMHSSRLFAEKVMPALRQHWPEYAQDDRFWCHPLQHRAQPAPVAEARGTA